MTAIVVALSLLSHAAAPDAADSNIRGLRLIAHRGGVVDATHIENNRTGIEEAIRRGYWMLEVDIRESKDGHLVVHHDDNFRRFYNDPRRVADMTWDQIKQLRSTPGDLRPLDFAEYAAACRGKIRLMLDTKGDGHDDAFYTEMLDILRENDLLDSAFVIGSDESREHFLDKAKIGTNPEALRAAVARGEDVANRYFMFGHAKRFNAEVVELCRAHNVAAVPSINTFHYPGPNHLNPATADIRRLRALGVTHFQIDSVYEQACTDP